MTHVFEKRSDGSYVVVRHLESWDVSAAEGVRQLLRAGPPGPLAPVPKKKKETSRLGTQDPIAGPLVAIARKFGVLAAEEPDGWTGEPSEWADADSLTQTFSALAQKYGAGFKLFVAERVAGDYDKALVETRLDAAIAGNGLVMFSFTSCPFCKKAKEALDAKGAKYEVFELDEDADGAALRARIGARTGRTSVPAIWISGEYIGGLNDGVPGLLPLDRAGTLDAKLRSAGAL